MSDFKEKFSEYISLVEENLRKYNAHSPETEAQKDLIEAMN